MSYTLRRDDDEDESAGRGGCAAREPISLRRIAIGVSIGAVILIALAGLPSFARHRHPLPTSDGLNHSLFLTCHRALYHDFADLREPVDPLTGQRPVYPTTAEIGTRLRAIPVWQRAVMSAVDATPEELLAAGIDDRGLCDALSVAPSPNPLAMMFHWRLVLFDDQQRIVGSTGFEVPSLEVERVTTGDSDLAGGPVLEPRFPDWPRVTVFTRPVPGAQSDG